MEDKRWRFNDYDGVQMEHYGAQGPPPPSYDWRSYSAPHATTHTQKEMNLKKFKGGPSTKGLFNDPEFQRRKRIAGYKVYSVEGNVKGSLRKSIRWLKDKYYQVVYRWL